MPNPLKSWCRLQDLNPRPSVYKSLASYPICQDLAVSRRLRHRLNPGEYAQTRGHGFSLHPKATVASSLPLSGDAA